MNGARQVEDRLRAEYVDLLPSMQRVLTALMTEVNHVLLSTILNLDRHEQILVKGRLKGSESAIDSLRRRQEMGTFDVDRSAGYSLTTLPDLMGIRVLLFPQRRLDGVRRILESEARLAGWKHDHIPNPEPVRAPIGFKYRGFWNPTDTFQSELQIVSLLVGLFWEVEHSAIYKPTPELQGIASSISMKARNDAVLKALQQFEEEFDRQIKVSG
jgi:ppGpp synthetase/RelA/SpoT-type nucleotidyltranferase